MKKTIRSVSLQEREARRLIWWIIAGLAALLYFVWMVAPEIAMGAPVSAEEIAADSEGFGICFCVILLAIIALWIIADVVFWARRRSRRRRSDRR